MLFLAAAERFPRFFLIAFFYSPCYETPKNAIKTKPSKTTEGGKKNGENKATFFVMSAMSPYGFFVSPPPPWVFVNPPCATKRAENAIKKIKGGGERSKWLFFFGAAANARRFRHFFLRRPSPSPLALAPWSQVQ
jgi:hypothetical protein